MGPIISHVSSLDFVQTISSSNAFQKVHACRLHELVCRAEMKVSARPSANQPTPGASLKA